MNDNYLLLHTFPYLCYLILMFLNYLIWTPEYTKCIQKGNNLKVLQLSPTTSYFRWEEIGVFFCFPYPWSYQRCIRSFAVKHKFGVFRSVRRKNVEMHMNITVYETDQFVCSNAKTEKKSEIYQLKKGK